VGQRPGRALGRSYEAIQLEVDVKRRPNIVYKAAGGGQPSVIGVFRRPGRMSLTVDSTMVASSCRSSATWATTALDEQDWWGQCRRSTVTAAPNPPTPRLPAVFRRCAGWHSGPAIGRVEPRRQAARAIMTTPPPPRSPRALAPSRLPRLKYGDLSRGTYAMSDTQDSATRTCLLIAPQPADDGSTH
jgi:hypothetical protein